MTKASMEFSKGDKYRSNFSGLIYVVITVYPAEVTLRKEGTLSRMRVSFKELKAKFTKVAV